MCMYWHSLLLISIFVKPALVIPSCENDNTKFFTSRVFSLYWPGFPSRFLVSLPFHEISLLVLLSFSLYLSLFEFSFSFNLNNSFGRPLHRISNKIAGTIFVRSSFLVPSLHAIPPRLPVYGRLLSHSRLFDLSDLELLRLTITAGSRLVKARLISSVHNPYRGRREEVSETPCARDDREILM